MLKDNEVHVIVIALVSKYSDFDKLQRLDFTQSSAYNVQAPVKD